MIWWLKDSKKERDSNIMKAVVGLIKYDAITLEKLQNVGRGDYDKFTEKLSAEGIPKAICDLLFEKYVVEATVLEAIGKHAFLREVKGLIDEEMPSLKKQEVFFGLLGLMKYPAITHEMIQNISDNKKEFAERLSAKGVPDAISDLLFEKYVPTKKRIGIDETDKDEIKVCIKQDIGSSMGKFFNLLSTGKVGDDFLEFSLPLFGSTEYPKKLLVRNCYEIIFHKIMEALSDEDRPNVATVMGTPGIGKTVFGVFAIHRLLKEGKTVMYYHAGKKTYVLFAPKVSPILAAARVDGFQVPEPTKTGYVGRITTRFSDRTSVDGVGLVEFLVANSELYYIHDPPKGGIDLEEFMNCKTIIVSSPHRAK